MRVGGPAVRPGPLNSPGTFDPTATGRSQSLEDCRRKWQSIRDRNQQTLKHFAAHHQYELAVRVVSELVNQ